MKDEEQVLAQVLERPKEKQPGEEETRAATMVVVGKELFGLPFRKRDIIGCGWNRSDHSVFFVRDGAMVGSVPLPASFRLVAENLEIAKGQEERGTTTTTTTTGVMMHPPPSRAQQGCGGNLQLRPVPLHLRLPRAPPPTATTAPHTRSPPPPPPPPLLPSRYLVPPPQGKVATDASCMYVLYVCMYVCMCCLWGVGWGGVGWGGVGWGGGVRCGLRREDRVAREENEVPAHHGCGLGWEPTSCWCRKLWRWSGALPSTPTTLIRTSFPSSD